MKIEIFLYGDKQKTIQINEKIINLVKIFIDEGWRENVIEIEQLSEKKGKRTLGSSKRQNVKNKRFNKEGKK